MVSPYDAELYGHWWHEGPMFLNDVFRQIHFDQSAIETVTPGQYLERHPTNQLAVPCASSWGAKGYNAYWLDESNAWVYRHTHTAAERMVELAQGLPDACGLARRALNQAARELLLAQSSDWAFIMKTGTMVSYAERRVNEHIVRFNRLYEDLKQGRVDEAWLREVEARDNIFPDLDYRLYAR
jgi:1,4-alpha-glucan branching enzyme